MKRFLIFTLVILILVPSIMAGRRVRKAGKIENGEFIDLKYDYKIKLLDNWDANVNKDKNNARLVMIQKNYAVPPDYADAEDYTQIPRIVVYADTTSMSELTFIDSLTSDSYSSDQKKAMRNEFEILNETDLVPKGRKPIRIGDDVRGVQWTAEAKYVKEVATSASAVGGKRVYGAYGGAIVALKNKDTIVLFHLICEKPYFDSIFAEMMKIISSFQWISGGKD